MERIRKFFSAEEKSSFLLHSCGILPSKIGYRYLQTALIFLLEHPDKTVWDACSFTTKKYNARPLPSRENMGTAIKVAFHQPFIKKC